MDIKNEAHEYALKAMEAELTKIEEAYIAGYEAGKKVGGFKPVIQEDNIEWVDMSLPSGTLWSEPLQKDLDCIEAVFNEVKDLDLPTEEDFRELLKETKHVGWGISPRLISRNGVRYHLDGNLWMKGESDKDMKAPAFASTSSTRFHRFFMGERFRVVLVKHPDKK